jgi:glycosyltransferase involved in cell wall biosynthesis
MSDLVGMRHTVFHQMVSEVDHIVAVCKWVREVLLLNDVPAAKVSVSRHGISWTPNEPNALSLSSTSEGSESLRLAFLGRFDPTKGIHVLIDALKLIPTLEISLHVYGVVQNTANAAYREKMLALACGDPRIAFQDPLRPEEIVPRLRQYDFLVIPSQWIETGPLVALEAFAAGIPVIGWDIGGISETVRHGVDGSLIQGERTLGGGLRCVTEDAKLRAQLKAGSARRDAAWTSRMKCWHCIIPSFIAATLPHPGVVSDQRKLRSCGMVIGPRRLRKFAPAVNSLRARTK